MVTRLLREIAGVSRMLGPWRCAVWLTGLVLHAPTVLRSRSLAAVDEFHGPVTRFRVFGKTMRVEPAPMGVCREVIGTDCYRLAALSGKERLLIDLGANVGMASLAMAARCPGAHITAVEMNPRAAAQFARNMEMNGLSDRVTVRCGRLGDPHADDGSEHSASPMVDASDCLSEGQVCDFLKCDIEGAEHSVITPRAAWLGRVRRISLEYHWNDQDGQRLAAILKGHGFEATTAPHGTLGYVFAIRRSA